MALSIDATTAGTPGNPGTSWTHTGGSDLPNGIALVFCITDFNGLSSATYGGQTLISKKTELLNIGSYILHTLYLLNPPTGNQTVSVVQAGAGTTNVPAAAMTITGVSQTVPFGTVESGRTDSAVSSYSDTITPTYSGSIAIELEGAYHNPGIDLTQDNGQTFQAQSLGQFTGLEIASKAFTGTNTLTLGFSAADLIVPAQIILEIVDSDVIGGGNLMPLL